MYSTVPSIVESQIAAEEESVRTSPGTGDLVATVSPDRPSRIANWPRNPLLSGLIAAGIIPVACVVSPGDLRTRPQQQGRPIVSPDRGRFADRSGNYSDV